jgi:Zn-dependent protease
VGQNPRQHDRHRLEIVYAQDLYFKEERADYIGIPCMNADSVLLGITWYVVFLLSTTCHEAAHALAAKLGGDLTAFHGGQVSLDPIPHIRREPFGMVLFPLLSYFVGGWMMGWASAPYDPYWAQRHPHRAGWMSLAGPGANLSLAILAALSIHIGIWVNAFAHPDSADFTHIVIAAKPGAAEGAAVLLSIMFSLNLLLCAFNLLPIPPLDGFGVIGLLVSEQSALRLQNIETQMRAFSMVGLIIAWKIFDPIFDPIFTLALKALYPGYGYGS